MKQPTKKNGRPSGVTIGRSRNSGFTRLGLFRLRARQQIRNGVCQPIGRDHQSLLFRPAFRRLPLWALRHVQFPQGVTRVSDAPSRVRTGKSPGEDGSVQGCCVYLFHHRGFSERPHHRPVAYALRSSATGRSSFRHRAGGVVRRARQRSPSSSFLALLLLQVPQERPDSRLLLFAHAGIEEFIEHLKYWSGRIQVLMRGRLACGRLRLRLRLRGRSLWFRPAGPARTPLGLCNQWRQWKPGRLSESYEKRDALSYRVAGRALRFKRFFELFWWAGRLGRSCGQSAVRVSASVAT